MAITYAVLFGIMFGDVGQGMLLGLIGYFVMYKKMHMELGRVVRTGAAFSALLFGFVYGSVFGFEHVLDPLYHAAGLCRKAAWKCWSPNGINMHSDCPAWSAGVFLIVCAIAHGHPVPHSRKHVIAKDHLFRKRRCRAGVLLQSLIALLLPMLGMQLPFVGSVPYLMCCAWRCRSCCMYFAEPICARCARAKSPGGARGRDPYERFLRDVRRTCSSFASNTMSFLRVGGFVLAHAGMMTVVFTLADMTGESCFMCSSSLVGNLFVMALEGLFVGIQVLRLEFYEMFSRFFDADGRPFDPLRVRLNVHLHSEATAINRPCPRPGDLIS